MTDFVLRIFVPTFGNMLRWRSVAVARVFALAVQSANDIYRPVRWR